MQAQVKQCENCQKDFTIESRDFLFYEKICVPLPSLCPECRQMRRMSFRNERTLYRRKCDKTGKDIISVFASDAPYTVYDQAYWYSDQFDPMQYSFEFDFSRPFFSQFGEFMRSMPWPSLRIEACENSDYSNGVGRP